MVDTKNGDLSIPDRGLIWIQHSKDSGSWLLGIGSDCAAQLYIEI